uniref:Parasporal crystal protein Cry18Ca n=1 Tax=Paenibacillus popilliae TaxID=78057 RepID=C18CA_PAEPP|nr:RecName: Full=Parasporal crystal protein Cry18Ca; AltName: Full=78 kDa crystal protein; AltName: Full=Crystaline parasporal protoxin; AltName: Full=Parasporal delta-endotoxin CryXVIIIC(a) [Paenibacillus popilliae]AAF89668.1 parasporal crystal protein Cry18Ca1 [Paenibacillus popilliae ATCC 14706]
MNNYFIGKVLSGHHINNNGNGNTLSRTALTPTNNNVNRGDLVTNGLTPIDNNFIGSNGFIPRNVTRKDPFRKRTTQEFIREWTEWKEKSASLFTAPIVGVITSTLLEALKKLVAGRVLMSLTNLLFPNNSTSTMEEILRATEQYIQEQLDTVTWNRVSQELEGLKNDLRTFNDQIDDFLQNRVGISPLAIIDSINTMQQLFVNRLPQFQVSDDQVLLLPLFAQAVTLHLTFVRDIIINADEWNIPEAQLNTYKRYLKQYVAQYSNYALSTYEEAFRARFYPRNTVENMLEFKTFMTLNVLDLVSMWSLLKYVNLYVSTSANLYNIGDNKVNEGEYSISYWPFFNTYIQTKSNYVLSGVSGYAMRWSYTNPFFGEYIQDHLYNITASYIGGVNGPQIGQQLSTTELDQLVQQQARADIPVDFTQIPINCTLRNPLEVPYYATRFNELTSLGTAGVGGFVRSDVFISNDSVCGLGTNYSSGQTFYPDYYITNISATVQVNGTNTDISPLYFGENRAITSTNGVNKVIAIYNRKTNYDDFTNIRGTIVHEAPTDSTGFTISPLHLDTVNINSYLYIQENYGNNGDSLRVINRAIIKYRLSAARSVIYRLVLRVSGTASSIVAIYENYPVGSANQINTGTDNEGVIDNDSKFIDLIFNTPFSVSGTARELQLQVSGATTSSPLDIMNIILIPINDVPLY